MTNLHDKIRRAGYLDGMEAMCKLVLGQEVEETILPRFRGLFNMALEDYLVDMQRQIKALRVGREVLGDDG